LPIWFAYRHQNLHARLRLFCFPYGGGGASFFREWYKHLPEQIEICAIQIPGRENRINEAPFRRLSVLVDELAEALRPVIDLPFAFFGHSMGALISFELIRRLRQCNLPLPLRLFVSGFGAPQLPDTGPPIHQLPKNEFVMAIKHFNGTPEEVWQDEEFVEILLPLLRADFEICETYDYQPEPPLPIPIVVYGGWQDPKIKREQLEAWAEQTQNTCAVNMFPGDHFFLHSHRERFLVALAQELEVMLG
jgi:surfactin synthase thioesterase subunit